MFIAILLAAALMISVCLFLFSKSGNRYEIYISGRLCKTGFLTDEKTFTLSNGVTIICDGGEIYFYDSDCPDKVCINMGHLGECGQWAACLPNETIIKIVGDKTDAVR